MDLTCSNKTLLHRPLRNCLTFTGNFQINSQSKSSSLKGNMQHASGAEQSHHIPTVVHSLNQDMKLSFDLFMIISGFKQAADAI